ncbi:hypothetical protein IEQ34_006827 [Dendrobium chrysotoxum]|uniref:Uncharacterized protein n=1 Tax=Dendrobium chrysotoxum TaxID=161865 RepID=A0AAV7H4R4_DENCH|nr:hypothetical protein IEQ34_006827 [Dendrobium chrysotoxum]
MTKYNIRESHLRRFGHIKFWPSDDPAKRVDLLDLKYIEKWREQKKKKKQYYDPNTKMLFFSKIKFLIKLN